MTTILRRLNNQVCIALVIVFSSFASAGEPFHRTITYAVFKNETRRSVEVRLLNASGRYALFELGPGGVEGLPAQNGRAEVRTLDKKALAEIPIDVKRQVYSNSSVRALYFVVHDHQISTVSSKTAHSWNWVP
jgi:hypothetical protein